VIGWVLGASGAWGRAVALELLRRGFDVVALGRRDVPELAAWAAHEGRAWTFHAFDLLDPERVLPEGAPEALFVCSGATAGDRASLLAAGYLAPVALIEAVAERMAAAARAGRIGVFMGQNARLGLRGLGEVSAAQGALWTWCESFQATPDRQPGVTLTRIIPPRTASATQRFVADASGHHPRLSPPRAGPLIEATLRGRRRAGRRPVGAALSMLLR
jgi:NAD(P)-dependent dehydrogenase (short-subunit alcohol dehydrogenase family)